MEIFLWRSIKEHLTLGLFFTPSPSCPPHSLSSLLPSSFPGGSGKEGAPPGDPGIPGASPVPPRLWAHLWAAHTPQTFLIPYKLIFPAWFCFPWSSPIQSSVFAMSLFNVTMGRGRLVAMEQELSLQEHPCAEEWPKHLPLPGHGESRTFAQKWQTQMGFAQTE